MSLWDELQLYNKIRTILKSCTPHDHDHHFGNYSYLTPYQIALKLKEKYPYIYGKIEKPIGGKGTGRRDSLAQYIVNELSKRIKSGEITDIEGAFLFREYLHKLEYQSDNEMIESSSGESYDLSLFRYKEIRNINSNKPFQRTAPTSAAEFER